jgi:diaminopimelate epimerase
MRPYFRLSGGGNDFLALVEPDAEPTLEEIRAYCRRGLSAGADGLFVLERASSGARIRYYNADGGRADLCLNGTRCAVRLACHLGWAQESLEIETGSGIVGGRLTGPEEVALGLQPPEEPRPRTLGLGSRSYRGWEVQTGVPHFVLIWPATLADVPVNDLGARLRRHPDWGEPGSNIDFVRFFERHRLEIRTFERGVEAETLACGTGVMAATAVGLTSGELELPVRALTSGGFELRVESAGPEVSSRQWLLIGDARLVARGDLLPGASRLARAPRWS